jgi:hypothetical protein
VEDPRQIITVRSLEAGPCPLCGKGFWSGDGADWLDQQVNHILEHEGTAILHAGQETGGDFESHPHQSTVVVIGVAA